MEGLLDLQLPDCWTTNKVSHYNLRLVRVPGSPGIFFIGLFDRFVVNLQAIFLLVLRNTTVLGGKEVTHGVQ